MKNDKKVDSHHHKKEMTVRRVFHDVSPKRMWDMWTIPEHFANWFGTPPFTTPISTISMDVKPGGEWKATMISKIDGTKLPFIGSYMEVNEPEHLVMVFNDLDNPHNKKVEILTVMINDLGDMTELIVNQKGNLPDSEYPKLEHDYLSFFDRLEKYLKRSRKYIL